MRVTEAAPGAGPLLYVTAWSGPRFTSVVLYTCTDFDEARATELTREFFRLSEYETASF
ncbi:MAG TPA: hypothetical protein VF584_13465 [Longimicrobium sp.]|jgi:hypothetical protein